VSIVIFNPVRDISGGLSASHGLHVAHGMPAAPQLHASKRLPNMPVGQIGVCLADPARIVTADAFDCETADGPSRRTLIVRQGGVD
jgi:hypothetical protein